MAHLRLDFYEYRPDLDRVVDRVWYSCSFALASAAKRKTTGRRYLSTIINTPAFLSRIPCNGYLVISLTLGRTSVEVASTTYSSVPSVRSSVVEADDPPAELLSRAFAIGAHAIGLIRPGRAGCCRDWSPSEIEAEYGGYLACPDETWVQINAGRFAVQVRLVKVAPIDTERSFASGDYYIYHPARIVVNLPEARA